jgi:hypothetical protein
MIFLLIEFQLTSSIPLGIVIEPEGEENVPAALHIFSKIYYSPSSAMLLLFNVEKWNA